MSTVARHAWLDEITSPTTAKSRMMEAAQSWDVDPFCAEAANPNITRAPTRRVGEGFRGDDYRSDL